MTSEDVVKALRKSASSLKEVADKLAAFTLSVQNYDLPDAFWCVVHTQFYALEDSIYWLELRYHDCTSIRDRLSRLADAEEAFFRADYEKADIDYTRKCESFREEQIRLAKELEAIADYVAEKAADTETGQRGEGPASEKSAKGRQSHLKRRAGPVSH